ncbi:MAG TPA: c-type cytochrome [Methylocystis sp.]|nr:c-type cytochrome [Methylocystis sp.]
MRTLSTMLIGLALAFSVSPVVAQSALPSLGEHIAKGQCVACHQVAPDIGARDLNSKAPSFVDVANMPSTTELSIKVFLRSSHRSMPNFILSPEEVDAIAAYILSLKQK